MLLALILVAITTIALSWLLLSLASLALPLIVATAAGQLAHHSGATLLASLALGAALGAATLFFGQLLFATLRDSLTRTGLLTLFAAPAAIAGYAAGHGAAAIGIASASVQLFLGSVTALIVTASAIARLRAGLRDATADGEGTMSAMHPVASSPAR